MMINIAIYITGIPLILLPFLILFVAIILSTLWLLKKFKIVETDKIPYLFHITKGLVLSLLGVLLFVAITQVTILIIQSIVNNISK